MEKELSGRLASLTRTIDHLALERQSIEIPDYSPTLVRMGGHLASIAAQTKSTQDAPAMRLTPERMAARITEAANGAREADRATISKSLDLHCRAHADVGEAIGKLRTGAQQRWHMLYTGIGTAFTISFLWLAYLGWAANIGPQSWLWSERVARRVLGEASLWDAGIRLMRAGNPEGWQAIINAADMRRENRETIDACERTAAKIKKPVKCTISVGKT